MRKRLIGFFAIAAIAAVGSLLYACGSGTPAPGMGTVGVFLRDGPISTLGGVRVSQLWVRITCIRMVGREHTPTLYDGNCDGLNPDGGMVVDLLSLEPNPLFVQTVQIPADTYTTLELTLSGANSSFAPFLVLDDGTGTTGPVGLTGDSVPETETTYFIPLTGSLQLGMEGLTNLIVDITPILTADLPSPSPTPVFHIDLSNNFSTHLSTIGPLEIEGTVKSISCGNHTLTLETATGQTIGVTLGSKSNLDATQTPTPTESPTPTPTPTPTSVTTGTPTATPSAAATLTPRPSNTNYLSSGLPAASDRAVIECAVIQKDSTIRAYGLVSFTHRLTAQRLIVDPPVGYTTLEGAIATISTDSTSGMMNGITMYTNASRTPVPVAFERTDPSTSTRFYNDAVSGIPPALIPEQFLATGQWIVVIPNPTVTPLTAIQVIYKRAFYPTSTPTPTPTATETPTATATPTP